MKKEKRGAGRPTLLTPETQAKIVEALRAGNYRYPSAQFAGVSPRSFQDWMQRGETEGRGIYADFRAAVIEAEKSAEIRAVAIVMKAATTDPRNAQWWLSHKFPERWADKSRVRTELTGKNGTAIQVESSAALDDATDDEITEAIDRLRKERASREVVRSQGMEKGKPRLPA